MDTDALVTIPIDEPATIHVDEASIVPLDPNVLPAHVDFQPPMLDETRGVVSKCSLCTSLIHWAFSRYLALVYSWFVWIWIYMFTTDARSILWIAWLALFPVIQTLVPLIHICRVRQGAFPSGAIYCCAMPGSCTIDRWPLVDALLLRGKHSDCSLVISVLNLISQAVGLGVLGAVYSDLIDADRRRDVVVLAVLSVGVAGFLSASTRLGPFCVKGGGHVRDYLSEDGLGDEDDLLRLCKLCRRAEQLPAPFPTRALFVAWASSADPGWRRTRPPPQHVASALLAQSPLALQYLSWLTQFTR